MGDKFLKARKHFPITRRLAYLNHATVSPLSVKVRDAIRKQLDEQVTAGAIDVEPVIASDPGDRAIN